MRLFIQLAVIGLVLVNATTLSAAPPNIVFILIDDMGWRDVGFAGNAFVETPHIDHIAREGIQFTQAYASAPNCAPTRACLMSGQYTPRHGVYTVIDPRHDPGQPHHKVIAAKSNEALSGDVVTIAEVLKQRGYATACFGMWNLGRGRSGPSTPTGQGFDIFREPKQLGFEKDAYFDSNGRYCSDVLTDESLQFMEANREKPFFVYLATHDVHSPLDPKPELVEKYRRKAARTGEDSAAINQAAMVDAVDANLGRVLAKIEELKLDDNTMVVFTSDNGGTPQYVAPLNGSKGALYEGGIRVPAAIWWKGIKQPGRVSDEPILSMDFYPTLTELAGAKLPQSQLIDGVSLMPLLRGEKSLEREAVFWHFPCYIGRGEPSSAVRMGDWKLIEKFQDESFELYNLRDDVGEKHNLAKQNPAKLRELQKVLSDWQATTLAPRPTQANPAYDPSTPLNNRGGSGKKKGNKPQGQGRRDQVDRNK
ncbi:MAG: sulfatase [Planctomycetaceae bacterium]|nr:sulfatase [Planctomycetaceae bacterium]